MKLLNEIEMFLQTFVGGAIFLDSWYRLLSSTVRCIFDRAQNDVLNFFLMSSFGHSSCLQEDSYQLKALSRDENQEYNRSHHP